MMCQETEDLVQETRRIRERLAATVAELDAYVARLQQVVPDETPQEGEGG
jgi:hypothetical protein